MKKKIGILTTYFATNFGAMLQPFAMKRTLEQYGFDVELIRYKQPKVYRNYNPYYYRLFIRKNVIAVLKYLLILPILRRKANVYKRYMWKHIQPVKGFIKNIPQDKDFYIFGSDQIWNPIVTDGFDDIYFGNFPTNPQAKKIAYAASAEAIQYTNEECKYLKRNLRNFDCISVREQKLANDLMRVTGISNIETVLDPTLIADVSIYDEIEQIDPLQGRKYILFYKIRNCMYFAEKIYQYAQSIQAELLILSSWYEKEIVSFAKEHKGVTYLPDAGVEIFLGAIKAAECIFTPSFHGCVFPILFHKAFYSLVLSDSWNTRANDLLYSLGLENRLLSIDSTITNDSIDYKEVDIKLKERKKISHDFLKKSLSI